jgi:CspA family cold shock protein
MVAIVAAAVVVTVATVAAAAAMVVVVVITVASATNCCMKGTVKWYDAVKGYGFIQSEDNKDLFVHRSGVKDNVFSLEAGQNVEFEIKENDKGPVAINVEVI